MATTLTAHDVRRLAVEACRDPRSVRNAYDGRARDLVVAAVRAAAERLGYPPPPSGHAAEAHD